MGEFKLPIVEPNEITGIVKSVWVIPDSEHTLLVPNIGIIVGSKATLIIDTGFGSENAKTVLQKAKELSAEHPIFLTHTHCHPEHGFGANVIADDVTILYNETQWNELQEKGDTLLQMFRKQIPPLAPMLDGVEFIRPDMLYTGSMKLNLGENLVAEFLEFGGAHSRGDQVIFIHGEKSVLFTGDLVEEGFFGVLGDHESHVIPWIEKLKLLERLCLDIVVPGHGHTGGTELIKNYKTYFELAKNRFNELRAAGKSEAEIVGQVGKELINLHPDWQNQMWATKALEDLSWPARR
ncbi:MAG TPA: MBL fold metallo-hydrolase [Puia sp.]|nr:MBL fold metallo-hydrolase [Puia sp.]